MGCSNLLNTQIIRGKDGWAPEKRKKVRRV